MTAREYQRRVTGALRQVFDEQDMVRKEWPVGLEAADDFADRGRYAPRLDIAVEPFNITRDVDQNVTQIKRVAQDHRSIARIQAGEALTCPDNPRCLLAIES